MKNHYKHLFDAREKTEEELQHEKELAKEKIKAVSNFMLNHRILPIEVQNYLDFAKDMEWLINNGEVNTDAIKGGNEK